MQKLMLLLLAAAVTSGCATGNKNLSSSESKIYSRIAVLEDRLGEQQREIESLKIDLEGAATGRDSYADRGNDTYAESENQEVRSAALGVEEKVEDTRIIRVTADAKDVQLCLKNAGYYKGSVDGKFGTLSQQAVSSFQKDHGLQADGIVGRKTWEELKKYLQ